MVNDSSLPATGKKIFELDTQAGVMHLLASIRASDISSVHKNELRDLVFLYTNGGRDLSVRLSLEQKITSYQLTALPQKVSVPPPPPQPVIGKYRTAPSFATPAAPHVDAPEPVVPRTTFSAAPAWKAPVPTSDELPKPVEVAPIAPAPAPEVAVPEPAVVHQIPVTSMPSAPVADEDYLKRIREIKALVNEKVGNPVNLVDINNEVGREYMGALLDTMKKLNSGSSAMSAMKRLEDAYAAVEVTLEMHGKGVVADDAPKQEAPQYPPAMSAVIPTPIPVPVPTSPTLSPEPEFSTIIPPSEPEMPLAPSYPTEPPRTGRVPIQPLSSPSQEVHFDPQPQYVPGPETAAAVALESRWEAPFNAEPVVSPAPAPAKFIAPLAEAPRPLSINDVPLSSSIKTSTIEGDNLFTKEVDDGLQQLLMEWSIFKKSGLFGSGPKGREHPLFKKIAPLHIPLLLAGRFEGATQEIKQSITDYMNGWRYEQGLIYQPGETFEHYLRRVIRHILDLQKPKLY